MVLRRQYNALCLFTSGLVDDITFSHNEANGPKSKTTRTFHAVREVVAAQGAKSAVSDYIFFQLWMNLLVAGKTTCR